MLESMLLATRDAKHSAAAGTEACQSSPDALPQGKA